MYIFRWVATYPVKNKSYVTEGEEGLWMLHEQLSVFQSHSVGKWWGQDSHLTSAKRPPHPSSQAHIPLPHRLSPREVVLREAEGNRSFVGKVRAEAAAL